MILKITNIEIIPVQIPLYEPYIQADWTMNYLNYVVVKIETDNGIVGYGEAAPDPFFTGETQQTIIGVVRNEISKTRPTARNLFFALERTDKIIEKYKESDIETIKIEIEREALSILNEDEKISDKIGINGQKLIKDKCNILTHCNTGFLVTGGNGTALSVIYKASEMGKKVKVFADETRPLLQGARLTAWELLQNGIDVTLICDSAAASLMKKKTIDLVIVGADRIARNGDTANKIGTYSLAVLCREHKIPFFIAAPYSTFDMSLESGDGIIIEEREAKEITDMFGKRTAPSNINVYNPAFDVTPADYITGIITEAGIFYPPYGEWGKLKIT